MKRLFFATLLLAGMLYGSNGATSTNNTANGSSESAGIASDIIRTEALEIAAVDYCFAGSLIDPTTGESVDLFVLCDEDGLEQNIDLA